MRPRSFRRRGRLPGTQTVVVCAGDSLTHGIMSANYLKILESDLAGNGYQFVNAGVSMDLAYNVWRRLDSVIGCDPDVVIVLAGSNDVAAHIGDDWMKGYLRMQRPPQAPTIEWYGSVLESIVGRLRAGTHAHIAFVELPPLTEELDGPENRRIREYNAVLHRVAAASSIPVIPLYEQMASLLPAKGPAVKFDGTHKVMNRAIRSHWLLRRSWDSISEKNGLTLQTDHAHLNTRGATIVARQIEAYLKSIETPTV